MGLKGKLTAAVEFKLRGDLFHEHFRYKPHKISTASPEKLHGYDLLEGEFGHLGSVMYATYTTDGKKKKIKEVVTKIDEEKKNKIDLATWTLEYEMLNEEDVEHPISFLSFLLDLTKDVETHHKLNL